VTPINHRRPLAALSEIRRSAALVHFRVVISMGATRSGQFVEFEVAPQDLRKLQAARALQRKP
jgi:hypothetical protein